MKRPHRETRPDQRPLVDRAPPRRLGTCNNCDQPVLATGPWVQAYGSQRYYHPSCAVACGIRGRKGGPS